MPLSARRVTRLAAALAALGLIVAVHRIGLFHQLSDPAQLKEFLLERGAFGQLAFVASYAALQPFGIPGTVFVFAAPLIWPWPIAFVLSMIGTMAATTVGFLFARFMARDWVAARVPSRFRRYDEALARRAFLTVFVLRLVFWMPQALHIFFGLSRVRFATHFWASLTGYLLPLFLVSYFGAGLLAWARGLGPGAWAGAGLTAVVVMLIAWRLRR
jgi:uncharacterized membrane protein YdjX (TVP38/TMEM64 family)